MSLAWTALVLTYWPHQPQLEVCYTNDAIAAVRCSTGAPLLTQGLALSITLEKRDFKSNERIPLGVSLTNTGRSRIFIPDYIIAPSNAEIKISDDKGANVKFAGWDSALNHVLPSTVSDFVHLDPGYVFGTANLTPYNLVLRKPGVYDIIVIYHGFVQTATDILFPFKPWSGTTVSPPVRIKVL